MHHHEKPTYREDCERAGMCPAVIAFNPEAPVYCDVEPGWHDPTLSGALIHRGARPDGEDATWTIYDTLVVP